MRAFLFAATAMSTILATPAWAAAPEPKPAEPAVQDTAEQEDDDSIQDIVVTAQRRSESVQDVPIAISAFSADQLAAQGVNNALQLGQYVPNLVAQNNTGIGSANAYFLRGLGSTETIATFDPPVGTYVDDIYLSRQNANNLSMFDVQRVEVLRGPQGTLFGRNTTGGAINVIMADPGKTIGGFAEGGIGRFGRKFARGSIDLPVTDSFAVKVSAYAQGDDGYVRNVTTGQRLNDDDGWGVRVGVRGELASWATWRASYAYIVNKGENLVNFECNPAAPTQCDGRFATTPLRTGNGATSPYLPVVVAGEKANYGLGQDAKTHLVTSNLSLDIADKTTLSFITGFVSLRQKFALDFHDGRAAPSITNPRPAVGAWPRGGFVILNDGLHQQFTQEIKLNGSFGDGLVDYVAGFFYIDEDNRTDFADLFSLSSTTTLLLADRILRNSTTAYAGYVQADFNVTDQIKLTAGVRYTDETKTIDVADRRASCTDGTIEATCLFNQNLIVNPPIVAAPVRIPTTQSTKQWTPRFAINYTPTDDLLFFVSATKGFKSGGWNARATNPSQLLPFGPETVWSYEVGMKADLFDNRLRANITGFWMDVNDLQVLAGLLNPTTGALTFLSRNFADYRNKGIEAEFTVVPTRGLNLYANIGYQDDRYIVPTGQPATDIYGIRSVEGQIADCVAARAANKIPTGPNTPATTPSITACAAGIVTANGTVATPVRTPDWSLALGGSYEAGIGEFTLIPSVNASYRSDQEVTIANLSIYDQAVTGANGTFPANPFGNGALITGSESPGAWLFNASLTLQGPEKKWSVTAGCNNCFNESFVQSALSNYTYLNMPMTWEVRARINF